MCHLNPIELLWAKTKKIILENKVTGDLSLQNLLKVTKDA
jgi:transposase